MNIAGIVENDGCFYFQEQIMIDENHLIQYEFKTDEYLHITSHIGQFTTYSCIWKNSQTLYQLLSHLKNFHILIENDYNVISPAQDVLTQPYHDFLEWLFHKYQDFDFKIN